MSNNIIDENTLLDILTKADGTNLNNETRRAATKRLHQICFQSGFPTSYGIIKFILYVLSPCTISINIKCIDRLFKDMAVKSTR